MRNKKENIENEIKKTLSQFDYSDKLTPDPFFYSRLINKLENANKQEKSLRAILKPAFFIILILFNLTSIIWYVSENNTNTSLNQQNSLMEILSKDLNINQSQEKIIFEK